MKILITGDRNWSDRDAMYSAIKGMLSVAENPIIIHGNAKGADKMSGAIAEELGISKDNIKIYPAEWSIYGRAAGPVRNRKMFDTEMPKIVLAFHNNLDESKGTKDMVKYAKSKGVPVMHYSSKGLERIYGSSEPTSLF